MANRKPDISDAARKLLEQIRGARPIEARPLTRPGAIEHEDVEEAAPKHVVEPAKPVAPWRAHVIEELIVGRAGSRCECDGKCGVSHSRQRCERVRDERGAWDTRGAWVSESQIPNPAPGAVWTVVLTADAIDGNRMNVDPSNVVIRCQCCSMMVESRLALETKTPRKNVAATEILFD